MPSVKIAAAKSPAIGCIVVPAMTTISGKVMTIVQEMPNPSWAPARL
jgi:hypothetical protein